MAFAERKPASTNRHPWTLPQVAEAEELARPINSPPPGDCTKPAAKTMGRAELSRRKNDFFKDAFSVRGDRNPLRNRIRSDSVVLVELRTNVIVGPPPCEETIGLGTDMVQVGDEFIFITELSAKLAEQYQRPLSSISVHIQHSQCMFFGGTFEPAYTATISTLSAYVQPATNRRNAFVLSEHLEEALSVPPPRGFITFVPLPEENVACNGRTIAHALDDVTDGVGFGCGMDVIEEEKQASHGSRMKRLSVKVSGHTRPAFREKA